MRRLTGVLVFVGVVLVVIGASYFLNRPKYDPSATIPLAELVTFAERGDPRAQFDLGERYDRGQGVPQDRTEALKWFGRAAEQKDYRAWLRFHSLLAESTPRDNADHGPGVRVFSSDTVAGIKRAERRVGEIFAERASLSGKKTSVRGKVVRYDAYVQGKNWIRLFDGTGPPGSDVLAVTTSPKVKVRVGDTVLVKGVVTTNKDYGMGYKYSAIMEDAEVTVE